MDANEYTFHPQLGYISLNQKLNDNQLLAVSYSYTVNGTNQVYKVGEFSEESPVLVTKLLRSNSNTRVDSPMLESNDEELLFFRCSSGRQRRLYFKCILS
ncbi:hypothetical protein [Chryseobacterium indoltheticum]|uniref:hypothetical protein n=1 Tax=Chryseobacterium indoltheticum TaxID=254 RepID=UPI003F49976B